MPNYYTNADIGDGAVPGAHTVAAAANLDRRDDMPPEANDDASLHLGSRWRARSTTSGMVGPGLDGSTLGAHYDNGQPDARRQWQAQAPAGYPEPATDELRAGTEQLSNTRELSQINAQSAPVRNKAGSTGEDPARPAWIPRWLFNRPWGQWMADGAPSIVKLEQLAPTAGLAYAQHDPTEHGEPSPGGNGITVTGFGVDSAPNTYRLIPRSWDERLTVSDPTAPPVASMRRRWRL